MSKTWRERDVTVVELAGQYDSFDVQRLQELHELLTALAKTATPPWLVLDLGHTRFVGSAFLEVVFRVWKRLKERDGRLALCCLHPYCAEVIRATRLDQLWPLFESRAEAVNALAAPELESEASPPTDPGME